MHGVQVLVRIGAVGAITTVALAGATPANAGSIGEPHVGPATQLLATSEPPAPPSDLLLVPPGTPGPPTNVDQFGDGSRWLSYDTYDKAYSVTNPTDGTVLGTYDVHGSDSSFLLNSFDTQVVSDSTGAAPADGTIYEQTAILSSGFADWANNYYMSGPAGTQDLWEGLFFWNYYDSAAGIDDLYLNLAGTIIPIGEIPL